MSRDFHLLNPDNVRRVIRPGTIGVYQLARYEKGHLTVGYVGRSDSCLRNRLARHNHLSDFDYFWYRPESGPQRAFLLEAGMWHALKADLPLLNHIHPAVPIGSRIVCPYCSVAGRVQQTLKWHHKHLVNQPTLF